MNLYRISQTQNEGYDTYDQAVVAAESEEEARKIIPSSLGSGLNSDWSRAWDYGWCTGPEHVKVELIGVATGSVEAGVVVASFHA